MAVGEHSMYPAITSEDAEVDVFWPEAEDN